MELTAYDVRLAQSCPTKLYYKKAGYPAEAEMDHYNRCFSDGTLVLQKIAQLLYPAGIMVADQATAIAELQQESATIFDCQLHSQHKQAQLDILHKQGQNLQVIAIKARSFDSKEHLELQRSRGISLFRNKRTGSVNGEWRNTIEDVAWQVWILGELLPDLTIKPYLLMPDRYKSCPTSQFLQQFAIKQSPNGTRQVTVDFLGDPQQVRDQHFLTLADIFTEVAEVLPALQAKAQPYLSLMTEKLPKPQSPLGKHCRDCEFKTGFQECWGELAQVQPHIFDLYQMGRIAPDGEPLVNQLIRQGKVSMYDMPLAELTDAAYSDRQLVQIEYTHKNQEWHSPQLAKILSGFRYPLHFIDFETARLLIPPTTGLRPNEQVAFQWSCHTITSPHSPPTHAEWLNTSEVFPNVQFAESLMNHLNASPHHRGTVFTWGTHEASVLRDIQRQMAVYGYHHPQVHQWLEQISHKSALVDLDSLTRQHYFHPLMKHRTSLKWVVSAIWTTNPYLHQIDYLQALYQLEQGQVLSPYAALPKLEIDDQPTGITDGTAAMLNYLEIMYGTDRHRPDICQARRQLLLQYCRLDTLAMVIVWLHWRKLAKI